MSAESPAIVYHREMGITHDEFFRIFPLVTGSRYVKVGGQELRVVEGGQVIFIRLSEVRERVIGALCLPVTDVELRFIGYMDNDAKRFMASFDLHFRKGGG